MIAASRLTDYLRSLKRALLRQTRMPVVGKIDLGDLARTTPVSKNWGFDRGTPVDRLFIERFLSEHRSDIRGRVLEVANNEYTRRFGEDRVAQSEILDVSAENDRATIVLDLSDFAAAPENSFDCIICTQTLHLIFDLNAAVHSLHRMLKPEGVLLLTGPAITAISRWDMDRHGDHWRFTSLALRKLFEKRFDSVDIDVSSYGNVYAATAFLHGLAIEELDQDKLASFDPDYEILIALRAVKRPDR